uniref:Uncharacterized protein n=1 Tax=Trichobilharzia regenti TaxID=157069 RepID=A0AA85KFU4_TRIRE|nr:unnamed protein product [Trichobilharzia regenti]CAH8847170.1 unnamed protein product [Trichobilharzia regenti]
MANEKSQRKLVLHFDARNTLFLSDKSYRFTVEEALNSYITGIVWGHLRNELMETVNQEPSESDSNLQDKSMIPSHSLSSASSSSPVNDSVSDHSISITDEINDNETQQPSKIHFTDDMKENHSIPAESKLNLNQTTDRLKDYIEEINCKSGIITSVSTHRQPYAGENFENLTLSELSHFKSTLACWNRLPESPCIRQPQPDAISIYKLLERQIVKTSSDRGRLRKYLGNFTQTPEGIPFLNLFTEHLELLKLTPEECISTPYCLRVKSGKNDDDDNSNNSYHYLMPAFYRLLTWLIDSNRQFAIFIRTYGKDGEHILSAVEAYVNGEHPQEKPPVNAKYLLPIDFTKWYLKRSETQPIFHLYKEGEQQTTNDVKPLTEISHNPNEIYNLWSKQIGAVSVIDDFAYWQAHNYHYKSSKPIWFNPEDKTVQHILFDDNIRFEDDGSNVIDLQYLEENGLSSSSYSLDMNEVMKWENIYYVQADLLQIIRNRNYFIDKVCECETNLNRVQSELL